MATRSSVYLVRPLFQFANYRFLRAILRIQALRFDEPGAPILPHFAPVFLRFAIIHLLTFCSLQALVLASLCPLQATAFLSSFSCHFATPKLFTIMSLDTNPLAALSLPRVTFH